MAVSLFFPSLLAMSSGVVCTEKENKKGLCVLIFSLRHV